MEFKVLEKIGEGHRGEVYKVELESGEIAAVKWSKNFPLEKEWKILTHLNGRVAPKPLFKGEKFIVMEYILGPSLWDLIGTPDYYRLLARGVWSSYQLDLLGIAHKQLGRYRHLLWDSNRQVRIIDFERGCFSKKPRNFLQILGFYFYGDPFLGPEKLKQVRKLYFKNRERGVELASQFLIEAAEKLERGGNG
ncbi:MAG: hypothetical protein ABGW77_03345 [Campylobacterales bacterium]